MNLFNYVIYAPATCQLKFGITKNAKRRIAEHKRLIRNAGFDDASFVACLPVAKGVARIVETCLREQFASLAIPGHYEWIKADLKTYQSVCQATERLQFQFASLLGGSGHA
jgi:predicted GIY-YIG superfamily endonuclease